MIFSFVFSNKQHYFSLGNAEEGKGRFFLKPQTDKCVQVETSWTL